MGVGRERDVIFPPRGDFHFPQQFHRLSFHTPAPAGARAYLSDVLAEVGFAQQDIRGA
jgi:hypothetical protein